MIALFIIVMLVLSLSAYMLGESNGYAKARKDWEEIIKTKDETIASLMRTLDNYLR